MINERRIVIFLGQHKIAGLGLAIGTGNKNLASIGSERKSPEPGYREAEHPAVDLSPNGRF